MCGSSGPLSVWEVVPQGSPVQAAGKKSVRSLAGDSWSVRASGLTRAGQKGSGGIRMMPAAGTSPLPCPNPLTHSLNIIRRASVISVRRPTTVGTNQID